MIFPFSLRFVLAAVFLFFIIVFPPHTQFIYISGNLLFAAASPYLEAFIFLFSSSKIHFYTLLICNKTYMVYGRMRTGG